MNVVKLGLVLATLLLPVRVGLAQENQDELKNKILKKVEDRLRAEEDRILKEISKIIDEELSGWKGGEKKTVVKPKKEEKAPTGKKEPAPKEPGFLGVFPAEMEEDEKQKSGLKSGVILREIVEDSPAEKAGLQAGDIIVNLDGNAIDNLDGFRDVILDKGAGSRLKVGFFRNKKQMWRTVTLASRHKVEEEREENPGHEHGEKPEEPKRDRTEEELRKSTKKFLEKKQAEKERKQDKEGDRPEIPGLDFLALDDEAFESVRGMLEQFGMDPEQFFEKGKDGKWRPSGELMEMFKQFDLRRFFEQFRENMPELPKMPGEKESDRNEFDKSESEPKSRKLPETLKPLKIEKKKAEEQSAPRKPGWIGIVPVELSEAEALELKIEKGMVITEIIEGSPAQKAGLEVGDVLTHINGKSLQGEKGLIEFIRASYIGQKATFSIRRDGKKMQLKITLGKRKE